MKKNEAIALLKYVGMVSDEEIELYLKEAVEDEVIEIEADEEDYENNIV